MIIHHNQDDASGLWLHIPLVGELERLRLCQRVVASGPEIVERSETGSLDEFYESLLVPSFRREEVEPLEKLREEIDGNDDPGSTAHYFCVLLHDTGAAGAIASGVYASVQEGILAIRFLVTAPPYRGTGVSYEALRVVMGLANRWCVSRHHTLRACVGECVDDSEGFFNRSLGMRRVYGAGDNEGSLQEVHYELPHLGAWTTAGVPVERHSPKLEHLQIAVAGYRERLPRAALQSILAAFWTRWYVCPRSRLAPASWERHRADVMEDTLGRRILAPLETQHELVLLSRGERESCRRRGWTIRDLVA